MSNQPEAQAATAQAQAGVPQQAANTADVKALQRQVAQLAGQLEQTQQALAAQAKPDTLSQEQMRQAYGLDERVFDASQALPVDHLNAARLIAHRMITEATQQVREDVRKEMTDNQKATFYATLDRMVPGWEAEFDSYAFKGWAYETAPQYGQMLNAAYTAFDAYTAAQVFNDYRAQRGQVAQSAPAPVAQPAPQYAPVSAFGPGQAAPNPNIKYTGIGQQAYNIPGGADVQAMPRTQPAPPPTAGNDKPTYRLSQVQSWMAEYAKGAYRDNPDAQKTYAELNRAIGEGRVMQG